MAAGYSIVEHIYLGATTIWIKVFVVLQHIAVTDSF